MLVTLSTTHVPATDLGFLLHKNPARAQRVDVSTGTAHVFYPEAQGPRRAIRVNSDAGSSDQGMTAG